MITKSELLKFKASSPLKNSLKTICVLLIGLFAQGAMAQTTTVLDFDAIPDSTPLTNQYQSSGVLAQGVVVTAGINFGFPTVSGANLAYAPTGLMEFDLSIADVKTVSAYISGASNVGIYGYDANNNLVASSVMASPGVNTFISATSSGAAITKIQIHDGGTSFTIDDLAITSIPSINVCKAAGQDASDLISALPLTAYNRSKTASKDRSRLLSEVAYFEKLRTSNKATKNSLLLALAVIQVDVKFSVKSSESQDILNKIDELVALVKDGACL